MTIAIGLLAPCGLVLAADSEEGTAYPGDMKSTVGKIALSYSMPWRDGVLSRRSVAISGAGDSAYLAAIKQDLIDQFRDVEANRTLDDFDVTLRARIEAFYRDHVIPFGNTDLDLRVNLIIGATIQEDDHGYDQRLWITNLSTVRRMLTYDLAAVGSGEKWAKSVLGSTCPIDDEVSASIVVAYGIWFAKEHAGGCGKQTSVVLVPRKAVVPTVPLLASHESVERLDGAFRRYSQCEAFIRNSLLGMPTAEPFKDMDVRLNTLAKEIRDIAATLFPFRQSDPQTSEGQQ